MVNMVNLFFLKTFVDAARFGSVKTAALKNYITQPAVTQHIRLLEEKLECKLFERKNKRISLTPCGRLFQTHAENILKQYEEAKTRVHEMNKNFKGALQIATIYSIGLYQLQPLVRRYLKKFPKINIHLEYQPFEKIYQMVDDQTIDFGFVAYPKKKQGVQAQVFAEEEMVLTQSPHHPVLSGKRARIRDLNRIKFVGFSSHTPTRKAIDKFLESKSAYPNIVNEYDNIETLKSAITLGIGCSIVPKDALAEELRSRSLEIIPVKELSLKRPLGILYAKEKVYTTFCNAFRDMILNGSRRSARA